MLTLRERRLFDDLERQFYAADPDPAAPGPGGSSRAWIGLVAIGICVVMIAVCGLRGSPEGAVCFTGSTLILAFLHHHF